jgi:hypothetical protein
MRFLAFALAFSFSVVAFAGNGQCKNSYLPPITTSDSIQAIRAKLLTSVFFPVYSAQPSNVPDQMRKHGFFEFSECLDSSAFKGCYAHWLIASGEDVLIAFPRDGRTPFIADCPSAMREN